MHREIIDYKLVSIFYGRGTRGQNFEELVSKYIKDGYQPYGSLAMAMTEYGETRYAQPMVKYKEVKVCNC